MMKHKKLIAATVVFTFLVLLQASIMPLRAEQSPGQTETSMNSAEQGPNFIEEEGAPAAASKKSIVPIVLIGLGVVAVAAVLVLVVLKTKYDIVGTWRITETINTTPFTTVFTGDKKSGTLTLTGYIDTGTYTVSGKTVHFEFQATGYIYKFVFDGEFTDKNNMGGAVKYLLNNVLSKTGTWTGVRQAATTGTGKLPMAERPFNEVK